LGIIDKAGLDRRTLFSKFVIQLLLIMFLVEFVKGALLLTFLPVYLENAMHASKLMIGWMLAVQYIGDNLFRTPIGWLIDKIGYRVSMLTGVLSTLVSVVIIGSAGNIYWIMFACALLGVGTAPLWPCVITGTTEIAGDKARGSIMSVVYIAWLSGTGLGPFVSTYFLAGHYQAAFRILIGILAAVVLIAVFLPGKLSGAKVRAAVRPADSKSGTSAASLPGRSERIRAYLAQVKKSITVNFMLFPAMFAQTLALGLLTPVLTLYATKDLGLSGGQFRLFLLLGGAVTVGCMIPFGKWVDRRGTRLFLNAGFLLGAYHGMAVHAGCTARPELRNDYPRLERPHCIGGAAGEKRGGMGLFSNH
jgi:DHA1 family multidrug resistance protein-like MFS transporter